MKVVSQYSSALLILIALLVTCCSSVEGQQPAKIPRVGYLAGFGNAEAPGAPIEAFRQGLRELGYIEGKNIVVDYRYIEGRQERVSGFVSELVHHPVDLLVIPHTGAIFEAKQATKTIPIVIVTNIDPVANGIVVSLARPGGNITGLARLTRELAGKRLELLREVIPKLSNVGVLWAADDEGSAKGFKEYVSAATALKIQLHSIELNGPRPDFRAAFHRANKAHVKALATIRSPLIRGDNMRRIAELAIQYGLPCMCEGNDSVEAGGLMSYSTSDTESFRRAATYVDKILKGMKPADLPVERPNKFELVINLKTAKQIGLMIPPNVLARADKVIK